MKKLLSLLMALALLLSLSVTALAYEDLEPPLWQRWGYESLEEYLASWDETEEEYAQEVADYIADRAEQDAVIASFDPEAYDFTPALWEYYDYASKEEMMELWEIDEAGYREMVDDLLVSYERRDWTSAQWEELWAAEEQAMIRETKDALGLVYDINIMADGAALEFAAGAPVIRNSCTMAPLGDIAAALHAEASWDGDSGKIALTRGNTDVELAVDDGVLSFRTEGPDDNVSGGVFYLDSLPYVEGEEVYVPVRAVAEALGYEVQWSDTYRTAVLVDVDAAVAAFDENYTVLNAIFAMSGALDRSQTYQGEGKLDVVVKVPLLGDAASYSGSVSAVVVQNGSAAHSTVTYDMGQLLGLLALMTGDGELPEAAELDALGAAMEDGLELIYDMDNMRIYLKGQLFALLFEMDEAESDVWYVMDLGELAGGLDPETLSALSEGTGSIGQLICTIAVQSGMEPIYIQDTLDEMAETFEPFDDSHFTAAGNVRSLTYAPEDFDGLTITLNVTLDGDRAATVSGGVAYDADGAKIDCTFDMQPLAANIRGSILAEGTVQIDFTLTAASQAAPDAVVAAAPPADATVVDLMEQLMNPYVYVEDATGAEEILPE